MSDQFAFTAGKAAGSQDSLASQVCFSVYGAMLGFNKLYRRALKELDITYPQYLVLTVLGQSDNIAMTCISERLKLESSTLTPLLKRLEEQGIVRRKRYAFDERKVIISLTEKGAELIGRAGAVPDYVSSATGLSVDEDRTLRALLAKLTTKLEKSMENA